MELIALQDLFCSSSPQKINFCGLEGKKSDLKNSVGNKRPIDTGFPSMVFDEGKTSSKVEPDTQTLQLNTFVDVQAFLLFEDEMDQEIDDEDVLESEEDMDEDTQADEEEHQSTPNTDKPELSPAQETQESDSDSSSPDLKKYDNILPLTERQLLKYLRKVSRVFFNRLTEDHWEKREEVAVSDADLRDSIEGYYKENVDHREQTDKLAQATMNSLE
nr:hypothetical protein [Tanacetum cinerariifolium]